METAFIYWLAFGKFIKQNIATAKSELGTILPTYFTKINQFAGFSGAAIRARVMPLSVSLF